jgi:hypothetical protein
MASNFESNIFCKYVFDFPELTMYYLEQVITDLERFGLQVHCVPIFKFSLLLADKVIQNKNLVNSLQLRFARCICSLGYMQEAVKISTPVISQYSISPQEFASRFSELNRMRVSFNYIAKWPKGRISRPSPGQQPENLQGHHILPSIRGLAFHRQRDDPLWTVRKG